jgi:hypothetical protein
VGQQIRDFDGIGLEVDLGQDWGLQEEEEEEEDEEANGGSEDESGGKEGGSGGSSSAQVRRGPVRRGMRAGAACTVARADVVPGF